MGMKFLVFLCSASMLTASPAFSQQKKIDVSYDKASLTSVLNDLRSRTGYRFLYFLDILPESASVSMTGQGVTVEQVLDKVLEPNGQQYSIDDDVVMISRADRQQPQAARQVVRGTVRDSGGAPLIGVTVTVKIAATDQTTVSNAVSRGIATGADGSYTIPVAQGETLVFTYIGKRSVEIQYTGQQTIDVNMEDLAERIEDVVITGKWESRLESSTGASTQITGAQLREVGNQNLIRSLANINPSFMIVENLEFGSDPNRMPEVQFRGQNSFPDLQGDYSGNINQPLFIINGFEADITEVFDLDMNRVSTVTLLLDASAKAIYGSKAGNGVVIIETVRPTPGQMRVSYSGSLGIEAPDLTGYNLVNAREKFDFEMESGFYIGNVSVESNGGQQQMDGFM